MDVIFHKHEITKVVIRERGVCSEIGRRAEYKAVDVGVIASQVDE